MLLLLLAAVVRLDMAKMEARSVHRVLLCWWCWCVRLYRWQWQSGTRAAFHFHTKNQLMVGGGGGKMTGVLVRTR